MVTQSNPHNDIRVHKFSLV